MTSKLFSRERKQRFLARKNWKIQVSNCNIHDSNAMGKKENNSKATPGTVAALSAPKGRAPRTKAQRKEIVPKLAVQFGTSPSDISSENERIAPHDADPLNNDDLGRVNDEVMSGYSTGEVIDVSGAATTVGTTTMTLRGGDGGESEPSAEVVIEMPIVTCFSEDGNSVTTCDSSGTTYNIGYVVLLHESLEGDFTDPSLRVVRPHEVTHFWAPTNSFDDMTLLRSNFLITQEDNGLAVNTCAFMAVESACTERRAKGILAVLTLFMGKLRKMKLSMADCRVKMMEEFDFWVSGSYGIHNKSNKQPVQSLICRDSDDNIIIQEMSVNEQRASNHFTQNRSPLEKDAEVDAPVPLSPPNREPSRDSSFNMDPTPSPPHEPQDESPYSQSQSISTQTENGPTANQEWQHPSISSQSDMARMAYEFLHEKRSALNEAAETSKGKITNIQSQVEAVKVMITQFNENIKTQIHNDITQRLDVITARLEALERRSRGPGTPADAPPPLSRRDLWLRKFGIEREEAEIPPGMTLPAKTRQDYT